MRLKEGPRILERSATSWWKGSEGEGVVLVEVEEKAEHAPVASRAMDGIILSNIVYPI